MVWGVSWKIWAYDLRYIFGTWFIVYHEFYGTCLRNILAHGLLHIFVILGICFERCTWWFWHIVMCMDMVWWWWYISINEKYNDNFIISDSDRLIISDGLSLHLYFREEGRGKERGLKPTSSWCWWLQGVVASFELVLINYGVGDSF